MTITNWIAIVALAGCSASSSHAPQTAPDKAAPKAGDEPGAASGSAAANGKLAIERRFPDATWEPAAAVALATIEPVAAARRGITRLVLKPLLAPDGSAIPYFMQSELWSDARREYFESLLVTNGKLVDDSEGVAGASAYLKSLGFPGKPIHIALAYELMFVYGVLHNWGLPPSLDAKLVQPSGPDGTTPVSIAYDGKGGAAITVLMVAAMAQPPLFSRLVIHFDANAAITFTSDRETTHGQWAAIPVKL